MGAQGYHVVCDSHLTACQHLHIQVPDGWAHATINVGETFALGAQSSFTADDLSPPREKLGTALEASTYGERAYQS